MENGMETGSNCTQDKWMRENQNKKEENKRKRETRGKEACKLEQNGMEKDDRIINKQEKIILHMELL